ncbi:hypothetical protein HD806DRAFT_485959 [Xylariaceae sp. AK1471]|nr:hypothetical protein HD806DRAFT_485959 [Xylariaceae sp. AK1471]
MCWEQSISVLVKYTYAGDIFYGRSSCYSDYLSGKGYTSEIRTHSFQWFTAFNETSSINNTLSAAMYFANEVTLTRAIDLKRGNCIGYSPGNTTTKPTISLLAQAMISALLGVEVTLLLGFLYLIYRTPTFTKHFDTFATATIGAQLSFAGTMLPHLGEANRRLQQCDGIIGLSSESLSDDTALSSSSIRRNDHRVTWTIELRLQFSSFGGIGSLSSSNRKAKPHVDAVASEG